MTPRQARSTPEVLRITRPLPPGFLVAGAVRGLFKPPVAVPVLPDRVLVQTFRVEANRVRDYARLCGFAPAQGVPITWPHILSFPLQMRLMMAGDFPYPAMGLIHLGNRIGQSAWLQPGDALEVSCRPGGLLLHEKGQVFGVETQAVRDGAVVWSSTSLYLKRGVAAVGPGVDAMRGTVPDHKIASWRATAAVARHYARLSGDANPIHTSALGARILGFPRPLAHGMWTKARALAALLPDRRVDVAEAEVSFRNPLFLPGEAELYAAPGGTDRAFECRDSTGTRTYLRGRLSLF
ncbi:MaoC family dehydratase [Brevundimonas vesicularis]|uniref:MaoC family dehydratase n=1 Tax=Brevundimonas vesicularis TaxID=41276 RepID=UPI0038D39DF7